MKHSSGRRRSVAVAAVLTLVASLLTAFTASVATAPPAAAASDLLPARWKQIDSPGGGVTCAVSKTGQLWCWGKAEGPRGVAWNPTTDPAAGTAMDPVRVGTASNWVKVQISARHACALNAASEIWCWGKNALGQLGQGDTVDSQVPVKVYLPATGWTDVAVGTDMTCGIRSKTAYCWGDNRDSELFASGQQSAGTILLPKADSVNMAGTLSTVSLGTRVCLLSEAGVAQCLRGNTWITIPAPVSKSWRQIEVISPARTSTDSAWDQSTVAVANYVLWDVCGVRSDGVAQCFNFEDMTLPATLGSYTDWISVSYRADTPRWPVCGLRGDAANPTVSCFSAYGHENQSRNVNYGQGFAHSCALYYAEQATGVLGTSGCRGFRLNYRDTAADLAAEPGHEFDNYYCRRNAIYAGCLFGRQWQSGTLPETQQLDLDPGIGSADPVVSLNGSFFIEQVARYPEYTRWGRMFALTQSGRLLTLGDKGKGERQDGRSADYPMDFAPALQSAPTLTSSNDALVPVTGGKRVTLNGTYLIGITSLTVDGAAATGITETDAGTSVSFIVPAHQAKTAVAVEVTTAGGTASLANAFTYADPPSAPAVTGLTPGNGTIGVNWSVPSSSGDSAITGYTATASPAGQSCTWSSGPLTCTINGLTNGVAQTITVVATSAVGSGPASAPSSPATPRTVPGAPAITTVTPGVGQVTVGWSPPGTTGGSAITGYTATALPGGAQCFGAAGDRSCTIESLTNGQAYTVTVTASNAAGSGADSAPSPSVTPRTVPGAPSITTVTPADRSLVVNWSAPGINGGAAVTEYTASASPGGSSCSVPAPGLACTIPNLTNGTTYTVTVKAANPAGPGSASTGVTGKPRSVPGAPVLLGVSPGNASATLRWRANADDGSSALTGFIGTVNPGNKSCSVGPAVTECTISGLTNGASYQATVTATNAAGESVASTPGSVTPRTAPPAPALTTVTAGNGSALVQWTPLVSNGGAGVEAYTVRAASGGAPAGQCQVSGAESQCTVSALTNGTAYAFTVTATNAAGDSQASAPLTATPRTTPGAPTVLSVSTGNEQATVTWQLNGDDGGSPVTSVVVTAQPSGRTCARVGSANNCTITGLTNGSTYTFTVVPANAAGTGPSASSAAVEVVQAPGVPAVTSADADSGQVTVIWSPPASNGGAAITSYVATVQPGGASCTWSSGPYTCSISGLTDGTAYQVRVTATNKVGPSAPSGAVSFTPSRPPNAPDSVTATAGDQMVTVRWAAPAFDGGAPIADYIVRSRKVTSTGTVAGPSCEWVSGPLTCTLDRLVNGTPYVVQVIALNSRGQSAATSSTAVKPLTVPTTVRNLKATSTVRGRITLTFSAPAYNGGTSVLTYAGSCTGGGKTFKATTRSSPITVVGVVKGVTYTCKVTASNEAGNGPQSAAVSVRAA